MQCDYFDAGVCRSCTRMGRPYSRQLAEKDARVRELVGERPGLTWQGPFASPESHFRAKAKMVVGGAPDAPTLGILDGDGHGIDLRECGLLGPATTAAMPVLARFVREVGLRPYDVPGRTGELKHIHVLESCAGELMVRFVLRSEGQVGRIRRGLPALRDALPGLRVVSVSLLPQHAALPEGDEEILLTEETTLAMPVGDVTLHPMPGAFVQTNTEVAAGLYRQAAAWVDDALGDRSDVGVLDLYCGVGGFALHAAGPGRRVLGVEVNAPAVASARRSAAEAGLDVRFEVADATTYAESLATMPDLVVVNPPRRGIGGRLAAWLESSEAPFVLYSSCNPVTLAKDLDAMPSLRPARARVFDMFPQSDHAEVLTLLQRA
ncbi:methyltransferase domain-containing protein [Mobilicoccus massiliensis]|uniref:methyltransferase domain-containing protein n=1 Tax=Mobilicoccus massiliensis TaxID=1522310 RepID=UPI00058F4A1E|nr:methyltransferase domain-containing protein [Mobilicoccus massiliensis]